MAEQRISKVQASQVTYELHTLGWKAFQDLCVSVTAEILGQSVQGFLPSHDAGRDGGFYGEWKPQSGEIASGSFTVQCKFSASTNKKLRLKDLSEEVEKTRILVSKGVATNYILMTNAGLSGSAELEIRETFVRQAGIACFLAFGGEWISQKIRENPKLRMLVPRVYGLGDLSQILDERSYTQAQHILSSMGDDLNKFVITDAYNRSAKALLKHGFVLLLGEPASGKSTIAAALALGAIDVWGCSTLKICKPEDFVKHWNPHEPKQFFWVDDAFGATQYDASTASEWNRIFPHMEAALKKGARVLFTSRDYIYNAARQSLKQSAFPLLNESQVVIQVSSLSRAEKQQILYNHVKLGLQPQAFRRKLKPFLEKVSENQRFLPEIARRLGNPLFTKKLNVHEAGLKEFVEHPLDFLMEILRGLDKPSRAAIALVFMRGGQLQSPIMPSVAENQALQLIGGNLSEIREALNSLDGTLTKRIMDGCRYVWEFKHPTIRDAFAALVAEDPELLDIYLAGTPVEKLVHEVSCGPTDIEGIKVVIPKERFPLIVDRLQSISEKNTLYWFLLYRCTKDFLAFYIAKQPSFLERLRRWGAYMDAFTEVSLIAQIHEYGLLPEAERRIFVEHTFKILEYTLDDGFLSERVKAVFTPEEFEIAFNMLRKQLIEDLDEEILHTKRNFSPEQDTAESHFEHLSNRLEHLSYEFESDPEVTAAIQHGIHQIKEAIKDLEEQEQPQESDSEYTSDQRISENAGGRSVFDDIDA